MKKIHSFTTLILSLSLTAGLVFSFTACSSEDPNAPAELEIHDSYADVYATEDGAELSMLGVITNHSEMKTVSFEDLPDLTIDGTVIEATYEPVDSEDTDKIAPGKSAVYEITYQFDASTDHEWKFEYAENTVVSGLDDYVCIKEALRNFEGKAPVTMEDIKKAEEEQKQKYKEFLKEEKEQN